MTIEKPLSFLAVLGIGHLQNHLQPRPLRVFKEFIAQFLFSYALFSWLLV